MRRNFEDRERERGYSGKVLPAAGRDLHYIVRGRKCLLPQTISVMFTRSMYRAKLRLVYICTVDVGGQTANLPQIAEGV